MKTFNPNATKLIISFVEKVIMRRMSGQLKKFQPQIWKWIAPQKVKTPMKFLLLRMKMQMHIGRFCTSI